MAPETILAEALAAALVAAEVGVYRPDGPAYTTLERGIIVDGVMPDSHSNLTVITPLTSTADGRANMLYRAQILTRLNGTMGDLRTLAYSIEELFDHREYTPAVLGISWSEIYSTLFFDPDTQGRVMVAQNFWFRGRRP